MWRLLTSSCNTHLSLSRRNPQPAAHTYIVIEYVELLTSSCNTHAREHDWAITSPAAESSVLRSVFNMSSAHRHCSGGAPLCICWKTTRIRCDADAIFVHWNRSLSDTHPLCSSLCSSVRVAHTFNVTVRRFPNKLASPSRSQSQKRLEVCHTRSNLCLLQQLHDDDLCVRLRIVARRLR